MEPPPFSLSQSRRSWSIEGNAAGPRVELPAPPLALANENKRDEPADGEEALFRFLNCAMEARREAAASVAAFAARAARVDSSRLLSKTLSCLRAAVMCSISRHIKSQ